MIPYLDSFDAVFGFELLHAEWDAEQLAAAIVRSQSAGSIAWVTSNHDFPRVATRWGERNARAAAVLLLTLGGSAFVYMGEEIGMADGPGGDPPLDRFDRDRCRHPMQWESEPDGGFSTGEPWLPLVDPEVRSVADQRDEPGSILSLFRNLIAVRREIDGPPERLDAPAGVLAFRRGEHLIAINTADGPAPLPLAGEPLLESVAGALQPDGDGRRLAANAAVVLRAG